MHRFLRLRKLAAGLAPRVAARLARRLAAGPVESGRAKPWFRAADPPCRSGHESRSCSEGQS